MNTIRLNEQYKINSSFMGAEQESLLNTTYDQSSAIGGQTSKMGKPGQLMYGFGQIAKTRGSLITMQATPNDNAPTSGDDPVEEDVQIVKSEVVKDEEDAAIEKEKEELRKKFKPGYAFFVLAIVLLCRIMVQWHRKGLTYAYGYTALGDLAGSPIYEISSAYPQLK